MADVRTAGIWQREKDLRTGPEYPSKRTRATGAASGDCGAGKGILMEGGKAAAAAAPDRGRGGLPSVPANCVVKGRKGLAVEWLVCICGWAGGRISAMAESKSLRGEGRTREAGSRQYPTGPRDCGIGREDVTADAAERRWIFYCVSGRAGTISDDRMTEEWWNPSLWTGCVGCGGMWGRGMWRQLNFNLNCRPNNLLVQEFELEACTYQCITRPEDGWRASQTGQERAGRRSLSSDVFKSVNSTDRIAGARSVFDITDAAVDQYYARFGIDVMRDAGVIRFDSRRLKTQGSLDDGRLCQGRPRAFSHNISSSSSGVDAYSIGNLECMKVRHQRHREAIVYVAPAEGRR
ncbi:hypothetical protein FB451DRAFT_1183145 [Mycena latifolia]|nr:hypothetical protein FB451DRAFT_1183145 [Mycena latifolia]